MQNWEERGRIIHIIKGSAPYTKHAEYLQQVHVAPLYPWMLVAYAFVGLHVHAYLVPGAYIYAHIPAADSLLKHRFNQDL